MPFCLPVSSACLLFYESHSTMSFVFVAAVVSVDTTRRTSLGSLSARYTSQVVQGCDVCANYVLLRIFAPMSF
ncbi:hypothetical protein F4806DRAFT_445228 [Annulohypoxylon nitens]|nr:hypothetical protein F4806DRAFT_445228 [Annulohypoxylon nitens]